MRDAKTDLELLKNKKGQTEKERQIQQIPFRLHNNDYKLVKKFLQDDGWKFQTFVQACVDAYVKRDPLIIKLLVDWKDQNALPRKFGDKYTLSHRERRAIMDELEDSEEDGVL